MKSPINTKSHCQQGLSLVELLIAIALSSVLLFGVLQVFQNGSQSARLQQSYSEMQEGGRLVTELLARDIRLAGNWGCDLSLGDITSQLSAADAAYDTSLDTGPGLTIQNNVAAGTLGTVALTAGTDTITIRGTRAISNVKVIPPYMLNTASNITISGTVAQSTLLMIGDCESADIFTKSNAAVSVIAHAAGVNPGVDNAFAVLSKAYDEKSRLSIPFTRQYFIGNAGGINSLYVRENGGNASELVRNVENLQFTLSEDRNGDGSADAFNLDFSTAALTPTNIADVVSVQSNVTVSSNNANAVLLDRTYSVTVNIRNRSL